MTMNKSNYRKPFSHIGGKGMKLGPFLVTILVYKCFFSIRHIWFNFEILNSKFCGFFKSKYRFSKKNSNREIFPLIMLDTTNLTFIGYKQISQMCIQIKKNENSYFWQSITRSLSVVCGASPRIYRLVLDNVSPGLEWGGGDVTWCIIGGTGYLHQEPPGTIGLLIIPIAGPPPPCPGG